MSAQQTSYNLAQSAPSQPGMVSDSDSSARVRAFRNDNASPVPFGLGVCKSSNTDDRGLDLANTTTQFLGVLTWQQNKQNNDADGLAALAMGSVLEEGEVLVTVVNDVTPNSPVRIYIDDYSGTVTGAVAGAFGTTAHSAHTCVLLNAKFTSRASAGGVAKLRLNTPGPVLLVAE